MLGGVVKSSDLVAGQEGLESSCGVLRLVSSPQVACGQDHSLFLTDRGEVFSCGWGADGQTGEAGASRAAWPLLSKGLQAGEIWRRG